MSLKAQEFTGQRTWPVLRSPEVSPSLSFMLLQTSQYLYEDKIYCLSRYQQKYIQGGLLDRWHCNEEKITLATLTIYGILCIYPWSQSTLCFSSVLPKPQVWAKGISSKCMFPSLLKVSGYWVNTHSAQKSIKGSASCMPKVKHILQSFLNWSLGLDTTVCRVPETNCACWELLLIFILRAQVPKGCAIAAVKRSGVPFCCCCHTLNKVRRFFPRETSEWEYYFPDQSLKVPSASKRCLQHIL